MLGKLIPQLRVSTIYEIDTDMLKRQGIRGIITDLDNTLVGAKRPDATPELLEWLKRLKAEGFQVVIVSNNRHLRVARFSEPIGIPFIYSARKPFGRAFRQAMGQMGLTSKQTVVIGDQMLTDVLGGNRMGLYTIMVDPIAMADEGFFTRINRRIEKVATRLMKTGNKKRI
ncbi:YqeG family HAD IIIA-type phosphatase [Paenibacillus sp. y28]|uniref:YqeG family HAD IIIA-type phosphatase n=1 Tax=Paenibacillus sp. y28 TaxID=3129110 RepID=UPI0030168138